MTNSVPDLAAFKVVNDQYLTVHLNAYQNLECGGQEYTDEPEKIAGWSVHIIKRDQDGRIVDDTPLDDWDFDDKPTAREWAERLSSSLKADLDEY